MPKINLLPADLIPKGSTVKIVKTVNKIVFLVGMIFICATAVLTALFVVNSVNLNNLTKNKNQLLSSIKQNQKTEQSLFLIRDRLTKIQSVESQMSCGPLVKDLPQVLASVPASATFKSATLLPGESKLLFGAGDSSGVSQLLSALIGSKVFSTLNLSSFTFDSQTGYTLAFGLLK